MASKSSSNKVKEVILKDLPNVNSMKAELEKLKVKIRLWMHQGDVSKGLKKKARVIAKVNRAMMKAKILQATIERLELIRPVPTSKTATMDIEVSEPLDLEAALAEPSNLIIPGE